MFPYEDAIGPNLEAVIKRNQRFYYQSDATIDPLKIWSLIWETYLIAVLVIAKWKSIKIVVKWNLMEKKAATIHSSLKCPGAYWATIIFLSF